MSKRVVLILLVLSMVAFAADAHAQTATFSTRVPFPFVVGNQTLPAGTYQVQRLLGRPLKADQVGLIVIRGADPAMFKAVVTKLVQPLDSNRSSRLVFVNRGGQHYLSEVHIQDEKDHQVVNASPKAELTEPEISQEEVTLAETR